ncbi:hypothetical protein A0J48_001365 [Sphaerospermopsis aphanizomenoides BCCUSP55]|uniref:hypothetical protein n=1 Tax=Sphaerospermopsis aphanizomenoides TaxID=459663 RepID=UPI001905CF31|nr:hypothetical protein [Sphaerospermopsis aphanizomenoides]MBK1986212.1 hypothetical protein [Sphaerospermopsis aphanizomenoides BCCUSP55]
MANCPNCGSNHIQIKQETDVNWGRAIAGYALFGVVGAAVGAVTGEDRNVNACLDCGTSWKPQDLYNLLQVIEKYTGVKLNLAKESHRSFMNNFVSIIIPYLEIIPDTEKKGEQLIAKAKKEAEVPETNGYAVIAALVFLLLAIFGAFIIPGDNGFTFAFICFLIFVFCIIFGSTQKDQKVIDEAVENAKLKAIEMNRQVERNLKREIKNFMERNPL